MNVEFGAEAAQFLEKEYINGIFVAVYILCCPVPDFPVPIMTVLHFLPVFTCPVDLSILVICSACLRPTLVPACYLY
jgi:hypothetical protein